MKTPKIFAAALMGLASLAMTSCEDWLTIYPQNKLTDEQFWEDMNDLDAVRYAAYRNFASSDVVRKILVWGEFRSDNVNFSAMSNANNYGDLLRITDGRLDTASSFNDWGTFYTTINYCNQVLSNGDMVLARDPQFSQSQWRRVKAEMTAMRALNYFYLIRAFGNVPYINKVVKSDENLIEPMEMRQTLQSTILDNLISDVNSVKNDLRLSFTKSSETRSLLTKPFAYALLSDLYMWRGAKYEGVDDKVMADSMYWEAYQHAVEARRLMDDPVEGQYKEQYGMDNRRETYVGPYKLYQDSPSFGLSETPSFEAFKYNFESHKSDSYVSDEVIFEMPFNTSDDVACDVFAKYFGLVTQSSGIAFYSNYGGLKYCCPKCKETDKFYDLRLVYNCAYNSPNTFPGLTEKGISPFNNGYVMKYKNLELDDFDNLDDNPKYTVTFENTNYTNFIIYRKSDVLFIEAEAIALLKSLAGPHADMVDLTDAKRVIAEHRRRSYYKNVTYSDGAIDGEYLASDDKTGWASANATAETVLKAVLDEKQIEFVGEGKRWFDIVRFMERNRYIDKSKTPDSKLVHRTISGMFTSGAAYGSMYKHMDRAQRYKSNLRARWAFYNPVYYPEREASAWNIYQNPYWDSDPTNNDPDNDEPAGAL